MCLFSLFWISTTNKILQTTCEHKHTDIANEICELGYKFHQILCDGLAAGGEGPSFRR
jgi:hypothetical protein